MMERKVKDYFEKQTMPDECSRRIEALLETRHSTYKRTSALRQFLAAAAALVVVFITALSAEAVYRSSSRNQPTHVSVQSNTRNAYSMLFGLETRSREEQAAAEAEQEAFDAWARSAHDTPEPFAEVRDGRLYFIANGEEIDITDQCSYDTVFLYTYQDQAGFTHYLGVGGTPEHWGYSEVIRDLNQIDNISNGWAGGNGGGAYWDNDADAEYGWYVQFKELTGHPFPL